jgi:hypothetical protein
MGGPDGEDLFSGISDEVERELSEKLYAKYKTSCMMEKISSTHIG